jgi:hypothetical protein
MSKRIIFFNHFHNGDIHVSRGLVRQVIDRVKQIDPTVQFAYSHKNSPQLLSDISNLPFDHHAISNINSEHIGLQLAGDTVYFNTWYGQQNFKFMNRWGLTFDALYSAFDENCKTQWGFSLDSISTDVSNFFPVIDYDKFHVMPTRNWLRGHPEKKVFISNGAILSDQARHFSLGQILTVLAPRYPNVTFILSNKESGVAGPNIVDSSDIIRKNNSDLNENSFLASNCDLVVGKASGSFTFAMTKDNFFNKDIKFLAFCNLVPAPPNNQFWIGELLRDKIKYKAQVIVDDSGDTSHISTIISSHL